MHLPLETLQRAQSHYELVRNKPAIEITEGDQPYDIMPTPNAKRRRAIQQQNAYQKYQEAGAVTMRDQLITKKSERLSEE